MNFSFTRGRQPLSIHIVWLFIIVFFLIIYRFFPPQTCLFHALTGYPCLSCGSTRAAQALLNGDILGAIYYNPLIILFSAGLFFFSLFKLTESILRFHVTLHVEKKTALAIRVLVILAVVGNWVFLVVTGR